MRDEDHPPVRFGCCWHCEFLRRDCTAFEKENGHSTWCKLCHPARKKIALT